METVQCNLCGTQDEILLLQGSDRVFASNDEFRVVQCRRCRLVYVNPRPEPEELAAHYPKQYTATVRDYAEKPRRGLIKFGFEMIIQRHLPKGMPTGRALEIGCGGGAYLRILRERGWDVCGVEISPDLSQHAREQLGLDVRTGAAEETLAQFPDQSFDLIAMWHVIEHLSDPSRVLAEAHRILKPGGRLMLELPNFGGLSRMILRTYWAALDLPRHLYHFTPETLTAMLTKAQFQVTGLTGAPAAAVGSMSLQLLWNRVSGNRGARLVMNPLLLILFFPASVLLARARRSAHMAAQAIKA